MNSDQRCECVPGNRALAISESVLERSLLGWPPNILSDRAASARFDHAGEVRRTLITAAAPWSELPNRLRARAGRDAGRFDGCSGE
jgi:hypothetical protein